MRRAGTDTSILQPYFVENTKDFSQIKRAIVTIAGARRKYVLPRALNLSLYLTVSIAVGGNMQTVGSYHKLGLRDHY